jgi:putative cell wall-binding protein
VLQPGQFTELPARPIQELWFELRTWSWKSLAIVPTVSRASELDVAEQLVIVGVANTNRRMSLISAEGATVAETDRIIAMIRAAEARGDRVVVATDSVIDNPSAAPIIRAVNGTVLSVRLDATDKRDLERSVDAINRNRIIGMFTRP